MNKWASVTIWASITRIILRNRITILLAVLLLTIFMAFQSKSVRFSFTEANLLPDNHPINNQYLSFRDKFGEEGNLIVLGMMKEDAFKPSVFNEWTLLLDSLKKHTEISLCVSVNDLKIAQRNKNTESLDLINLINPEQTNNSVYLDSIKDQLFNSLPIYDGLLYNSKSGAIRSVIYLDNKIVNKKERKDFVIKVLNPLILKFEKKTGIDLRVSGMPYIRTMSSQSIIGEIGLLIAGVLGVTSFLFFLFFRSVRATIISIVVVLIGVIFSFGTLSLFNFEITVLTALVPPLIIVIGIPNCIFLINKYQQEVKNHGNQAKSLQRIITKVGNATLFTNLTTAAGFGTFITTNNSLLREFGLVASINIIIIFILSLVLIPIFYSYQPIPKPRHLTHLEKNYITFFITKIESWIKFHRVAVFSITVSILIISSFGIFQIKAMGSIIEDMPKNTEYYDDIKFYEKEFDGIMPLEIIIDTKQEKGVFKPKTLARIDELQKTIQETAGLSKPISVVNLVKYAKQSYYNGNVDYYELPTAQERGFIGQYIKKSVTKKDNILKSYVDKTGRYARVTTFMKDMSTEEIEKVEALLQNKINTIFPKDRYEVHITGKALLFQKGTAYLIDNLLMSLLFAVGLIALLMLYMFRSFKMVLISLIPNLLPLVITAGMMGYLGIAIKPSTILVFGIAFGISVDDTIHFLAKYRQELQLNHWKIEKSVIESLREAGVSMFYTSVVLFFGFSVFMISSFGGTVALGGLISATLLFAMFSNLIVLPSLLLSLEKSIANKRDFIKPKINIIYRIRNRKKPSKTPHNPL